jgi:hypothetical protein
MLEIILKLGEKQIQGYALDNGNFRFFIDGKYRDFVSAHAAFTYAITHT